MQRRFERLQQAVAETTMASILTGQGSQTSALLYGSISQLIVVAIGGSQVINDHLTMGALACCTMLSGQIFQPLLRAISLWTEKESVNHRRAEVRSLLDLPAVEPPSANLPTVGGNVRFENVTFKYDSAANLAFEALQFRLFGLGGHEAVGPDALQFFCNVPVVMGHSESHFGAARLAAPT